MGASFVPHGSFYVRPLYGPFVCMAGWPSTLPRNEHNSLFAHLWLTLALSPGDGNYESGHVEHFDPNLSYFMRSVLRLWPQGRAWPGAEAVTAPRVSCAFPREEER